MRKRALLACCSFMVAAALLVFAGAVSAQSDAIRVWFYPPWNISKLPLYLARETGIFEGSGLTIAWTNPGSNKKLLAALRKGEADIAVVSANHVIQNNATGGAPMILVGNTGYNYSAFLAAPAITRAADLKGKRIGTGEPGSTPDQLTRLVLRKMGIDPAKDVTLVPFAEGRNADRVKNLLTGEIAAMIVTAETLYELDKTGALGRLNKLTDHKRLKIYAGGGADYAVAASFLNKRRADAKKFMSGICQGLAMARQEKAKALEFVARSGRKLDAAAVEYLYSLYMSDVIPLRPNLKIEGIELAAQMTASLVPAAGAIEPRELIDATLVPELEREGRCNF